MVALVLLAIAASAAIVLAVPVRIDVELDMATERSPGSVHTRARWLCFTWHSGTARRARLRAAPRRPSRPHAARSLKPRRALAALNTRGFLGRVGRLMVELWRVLAPRTVDGCVRLGLEDPLSTGVLYGAVHAVWRGCQPATWNIRLEPEYTGPAFSGHARLAWSVRPGAVLWPVGTFVASPTTWRAVFAALGAK